ncbi:MAG: hydroxymethylbilane synthase [Desulfobacterales bacterium C00003060]|nr:MAG: hydroxymethylbilane synthase [Desulfobacterales bacterium S3730MH5]OEU76980.1 MAG: hydroxymethylbilane synthase [Desulfobacterales bacterium C00003060]
MKVIRIGTRGSPLALWQAEWVRSQILVLHPDYKVELIKIKTTGDRITDVPLAQVGGKALFVKEIEVALIEGGIDLAVHSMKDMPAEIPSGLCIGAVPKRENPLDVLISRNTHSFEGLPKGARLGSSSLRRGAQVRHVRPDIAVLPLRGNLDTRIRKLETEGLDAIIVAAAGVKRLGLEDRITEYLSEAIMLPAVGQGALAIEMREDDSFVQRLVFPLDHRETRLAVESERAFLCRLEGGCQVPIAAKAEVIEDQLHMTGLVAEVDGSVLFREVIAGSVDQHEDLGAELANRLLEMGGEKILSDILGRAVQDLTT